jgi:hypothetical protein
MVWMALCAAGAPREAHQKNRCASIVPESLNGEQLRSTTDGSVDVLLTLSSRQVGVGSLTIVEHGSTPKPISEIFLVPERLKTKGGYRKIKNMGV